MRKRETATYPLGPVQPTGTPLWEQTSVFQPWSQGKPESPYYGMAMYSGFVEARYPAWIPATQPGEELHEHPRFWLAMYSGFVNEHNLEGI
jgi:hypothetical protein